MKPQSTKTIEDKPNNLPRYLVRHPSWMHDDEFATSQREALRLARKHLEWDSDRSHRPTLVVDQKNDLVIFEIYHETFQSGGYNQMGRVRVDKITGSHQFFEHWFD